VKAIANKLQPLVNGEKKHLMFWLPPQHSKSLIISKNLPAHLIEKNSKNRIILGTYNYTFASDFSRAVKRILSDKGFAGFAGKQVANQWETDRGGFLKAFGMQSGITGTSADYVFIDDPIKSYLEAFSQTIRDNIWNTFVYDIETREQKHTSYAIIQTRWHYDDLSGRLLERDGRIEDGGKWEVLCLPALAEENDPLGRPIGAPLCPELHSLERLLERKKKEPSMFQSLYQQSPTRDGGNIFKTDDFQYYNPSIIKNFDYKLMSVDGAWSAKQDADYSVCTTWGVIGDNFYLIDIWRDQVSYSEFRQMLQVIFAAHNPLTIIVEDAASGIPIIQELEKILPVHPMKPQGSKEARAQAMSDIVRAKRVFLPEVDEIGNTTIYDFLVEVSNFPKSKNDDLVDSLVYFLRYVTDFPMSGRAI